MKRTTATAISAMCLMLATSGCSSMSLRYNDGESGSLQLRLQEALCEASGDKTICVLTAVRPAEDHGIDSALTMQVFMLFDGKRPSSGIVSGYVIYGGIAPEKVQVWEITKSNIVEPVERSKISGEITAGKVLEHSPTSPARTATISLSRVHVRWTTEVGSRIREPFVLRKVPAMKTWPTYDNGR